MLASVHLNPLISILLTLLFYVLCHVKGDFLYKAMVDSANNFILRGLSGVGYYILPNLERLNINETVAHGERVFAIGAGELILLTGIALAFTALFLWLGSYLFSRRDL
jgi:hypothetical protein